MREQDGRPDLKKLMQDVLEILRNVDAILAEARRHIEAGDNSVELRHPLLTLTLCLQQLHGQMLLLNAYAEKSVSGPEQ